MKIGLCLGYWDLFHVGHVRFLKWARSKCDKLIVGVGDDDVCYKQKDRWPVMSVTDRMEVVLACKYVDEVRVVTGDTEPPWKPYLADVDILLVNEDMEHLKRNIEIAAEHGVPAQCWRRRSSHSTSLIRDRLIPYRIMFAGWGDQYVIRRHALAPIPQLGASIEVDSELDLKSGMASSTRRSISKIWGRLPEGRNLMDIAHIVFNEENGPLIGVPSGPDFANGTYAPPYVSAAADALWTCLPGVTSCTYGMANLALPYEVIHHEDRDDLYDWIESNFCLLWSGPRIDKPLNLQVTEGMTAALIQANTDASNAVLSRDREAVLRAFKAQVSVVSSMHEDYLANGIYEILRDLNNNGGGGLPQGCGGGGYVLACTQRSIGTRFRIRRC